MAYEQRLIQSFLNYDYLIPRIVLQNMSKKIEHAFETILRDT